MVLLEVTPAVGSRFLAIPFLIGACLALILMLNMISQASEWTLNLLELVIVIAIILLPFAAATGLMIGCVTALTGGFG